MSKPQEGSASHARRGGTMLLRAARDMKSGEEASGQPVASGAGWVQLGPVLNRAGILATFHQFHDFKFFEHEQL